MTVNTIMSALAYFATAVSHALKKFRALALGVEKDNMSTSMILEL
jgi:hypothetical protein